VCRSRSALQRSEGRRGHRTRLIGGPRSPLLGFRALRGHEPGGTGRSSVPAPPVRRFHAPRAVVRRACPTTEVAVRPSLRFRAPTEVVHVGPAPLRETTDRGSAAAPSSDAASPGLPGPTTHAGRVDPHDGGGSLRRRVPRPGFGYPPRGVHHPPSRRRSAGASLGFSLQGVPLVRGGCPSRDPGPPDVAAAVPAPPEGGGTVRSPPGLRPRDESVPSPGSEEPGRRCLPGIHLSRAFTPPVQVAASSRDAGPLTLRRDDVPSRLGPGASWSGWIGLARFRAAGSPEVSHLATVATRRSPVRGAGSWFHLTPEAARYQRPRQRSEPPRTRRSRGSMAHGPVPPSFGARLDTSSVRQCLSVRDHAPLRGGDP
jgi:hypothetical protein